MQGSFMWYKVAVDSNDYCGAKIDEQIFLSERAEAL